MKNLKFRAWGKEAQEMFEVEAIDFKEKALRYVDNPTGYGCDALLSQVELMQFTGILDGTGAEIYDGDILEDDKLRYVVEWNQQNTKFCINPITTLKGDDAFVLIAVNYNQLGNGYFKRDDLAVIGNIHENPELIISTD